MNACFCIGPQNADPHCPCEMRSRGLAMSEPEASIETKFDRAAAGKCMACGRNPTTFGPGCSRTDCQTRKPLTAAPTGGCADGPVPAHLFD